MEQLQQLLRIRVLRLDCLRSELARELAALRVVDDELAIAADEVARAAQQRVLWENDWQQWLHRDGVLRHGQEYNLSHVALSAWEQDAKEVHDEVLGRREQAAAVVKEVRQRVLKAEQRCEALREQLESQRRQQLFRRAALVDSRSNDEFVPAHRAV
jgi:hypothetical protein